MKLSQQPTRSTPCQQRVRYLPGLEIHAKIRHRKLNEKRLVLMAGNMRLLHWRVGKPAGVNRIQPRYSSHSFNSSYSLEMDGHGRLLSFETYYPFGGTSIWLAHSQTTSDDKTRRYSGKERDATGLYYYGYRYYVPWLMRWLNTDPAGTVDGLNLFRMVRNNPSTWQDEDGRMPVAGDPFTLAAAFFSFALAIFPAYQAYRWLRDRPLKQFARQMSRAAISNGEDPHRFFDGYAAQAVAAGEDLDTRYLMEFDLLDSKQLAETTFREILNLGLLSYQTLRINPAKRYRVFDMQMQFLRDHLVYEEKVSQKRQHSAESPGNNSCPATPPASTFIPPLMTSPATTPPGRRRYKGHQTATEPEGTRISTPDATSSLDVTREAAFIRQYQRMNDVQQSITENTISALQERDVRATHSHRVQGFNKLYLADLRNFDGTQGGRGDWRLLYSEQGGTLNLINVVSPHHGHHFKKW